MVDQRIANARCFLGDRDPNMAQFESIVAVVGLELPGSMLKRSIAGGMKNWIDLTERLP